MAVEELTIEQRLVRVEANIEQIYKVLEEIKGLVKEAKVAADNAASAAIIF
jgi:hypothetical protein